MTLHKYTAFLLFLLCFSPKIAAQDYAWADSMQRHYFNAPQDIETKIDLAEKYLDKGVGYLFLQTLAPHVGKCENCKKRLSKHKIFPPQPQSLWAKLWNNVYEGNFSYIALRLQQQVHNFVHRYAMWCSLEDWAMYALGLIFCVFITFWVKKRRHKALIFSAFFGALIAVYLALPTLPAILTITNPQGTTLHNQHQKRIGDVLYFEETDTAVSVWQKDSTQNGDGFEERSKGSFLATSACFTDAHGRQEGLSVGAGKVLNPQLLPHLGSVLYCAKGKLYHLPTQALASVKAYYDFLEKAQRHTYQVLQAQLLAQDNNLLIRPYKQAFERERRLLCFVQDTKTQKKQYVLFNIQSAVRLYDIAEAALAYLQAQGRQVEAIVNIDTGANNILAYQTHRGELHETIKGFFPVEKANLLLLFQKK